MFQREMDRNKRVFFQLTNRQKRPAQKEEAFQREAVPLGSGLLSQSQVQSQTGESLPALWKTASVPAKQGIDSPSMLPDFSAPFSERGMLPSGESRLQGEQIQRLSRAAEVDHRRYGGGE